MCICRAEEQKVLHCFFFISAHWASGAVHPPYSSEVLVYWRGSNPELHYLTGVNVAKLFLADSFEEFFGGR